MEAENEEFEKEDKGQEDLAYVETLVSRTVSYKSRTTHERSSRLENGHGPAHTRWGSSVKDADISDGTPTASTITSLNTPMNLEEMEKEAKDLDVELEKMVLRGVKHRIDLDSIEAKSEERKRIREAITQAKNQMSPEYQTAVHQGDMYQKKENRHRENRENNRKQSITGYRPNKKGEFTVIVRDHKH